MTARPVPTAAICTDARPGTFGKVWGPPVESNARRGLPAKQVIVYYRQTSQGFLVLTVIARYVQGFPRGKG